MSGHRFVRVPCFFVLPDIAASIRNTVPSGGLFFQLPIKIKQTAILYTKHSLLSSCFLKKNIKKRCPAAFFLCQVLMADSKLVLIFVILPFFVKNFTAAAHCGQSLRLASAPEKSSTVVHSCSVLVAKLDLAAHCIRRLEQPF